MSTEPANRYLPFGENKNGAWYGKDIISVKQFSKPDLEYVFGVAHEMRGMVERVGTFDLLKGKILANLFYEPSTRTSSSFTAAMERLGGSVIPINEVKYSSVAKGESLPDTVRSLECYADVIVIRHPEVGSAALAAKFARKPVINAGDGIGEHPTQALLDAFTIRRAKGALAGLRVAICGDISHSRVARSNLSLLTKMGAGVTLFGPATLLPVEIERTGARVVSRLEEAVEGADVVMILRVQKERGGGLGFPSDKEYFELFGLTPERRRLAKKDAIVMHPGPMNRGVEIDSAVADGPDSVILDQVENGVAVRMAVLYLLIGASGDE